MTDPSQPGSACQAILASAKDLAPNAGLAGKMLMTLQDPRSGPDAVRREISVDQGLTATVLRAANSAFYRRAGGEVRDVTEAIVVLGFEMLRQLVIARLAKETLRSNDEVEKSLWRHALATALAAQACARAVRGVTVGHAFTCGMLHDVGKAPLYQVFGERYARLLARVDTQRRILPQMERAASGTDHEELGAALLGSWKLPDEYVNVARCHHSLERATALSVKDRRLLYIVSLGSDVAVAAERRAATGAADLGLDGHPLVAALGAGPGLTVLMADHVDKELAVLEGVFA